MKQLSRFVTTICAVVLLLAIMVLLVRRLNGQAEVMSSQASSTRAIQIRPSREESGEKIIARSSSPTGVADSRQPYARTESRRERESLDTMTGSAARLHEVEPLEGTSERGYQVPLIYRLEDAEFLSRFPRMTLDVVESLRISFEQEAGVGELSPDDPVYSLRWEHAEMSLRDRIRTLYGWSALAVYEREVALDAVSP